MGIAAGLTGAFFGRTGVAIVILFFAAAAAAPGFFALTAALPGVVLRACDCLGQPSAGISTGAGASLRM